MAEPRRALGEGAAQEAPTAPHATPRPDGGKRTGPERFWARWPVRVALGACLVLSGVAHCALVPIDMPQGFEVKDIDGEITLPVDILEPDDTPPPAPPPPPSDDTSKEPPAATADRRDARNAHDAGAARDAGDDGALEAGVADAARDAAGDAPSDSSADGPIDGASGGAGLDGAIAQAAGGPSTSGPKDPEAILGAAGNIQADTVYVMVVVNTEVIRKNPIGARMGYLLRGIPQWDEFMSGTDLDPVRDTDWVMIFGPSLVRTANDVVLVHYSAPDILVDKAVDVVSHKYDRGGAFDAGVPGVRASLAHADGAERVILRPQPHVLAVVPTRAAEKVARGLVHARVAPHVQPGEAVYVRVVKPSQPMPEIPASITEMRLRVVPRADEGADVFIDGDTADAVSAAQAAEDMKRIIRRHNDGLTSLLTHGLLDQAEVSVEGSVVRVHVPATRDQIATLVALVGNFLGVQPGGAASSPSRPPAPSSASSR